MAEIVGVVLAGGQSRRMGGGDKCLRLLGGKSLLARIVARVRPQVGRLVLNANGDPARFAAYGLPVAADTVAGFAGPLAGVLAGLEWAAGNVREAHWVATFAGDAPFVPLDCVARLLAAVEADAADLACAASGGRDNPVCGLWPVGLAGDLRRALVEEDVRKVDVWTARHRLARAEFADWPVDPFFNLNTPEDFATAERLLDKSVEEH
jgi:molybdopterin-guanine dinucleotide biosynthesis protein A